MASGRSGLSFKQKPPSLLSIVGNKPVPGAKKLIKPAACVSAPPLSSDEEDEAEPRPTKGISHRHSNHSFTRSSDSESESNSRATIPRTAFKAPDASRSQKRGARNASSPRSKGSAAECSQDLPSPKLKRRKLEDGDGEPLGSTKSSQSKSISSSADHLTDERGFVKKKAARSTYGKKYGSSQEPRPKNAKIKQPDSLDSLDSPKKPANAKAKFRAPSDPMLSSPSKGPRARFIKQSQDGDEGSEDTFDEPVRKPVGRKMVVQSSSQKKHGKVWQVQKPPVVKERAKFTIPAEIPDIPDFSQESRTGDEGISMDPLSSLSDLSDLSDLSNSEGPPNLKTATEASNASDGELDGRDTKCPWCGDAVPDILLEEFAKGKRLNVRMQTKFCQTHKKQTALDTWRERQYPAEIMWSDLQSRFDTHRKYLLNVVRGKPSHFRSLLADKIETGKARSLKKEDNLNPGYYGPRGFNLMCDYLLGEFGDLLKEMAVSDRVIAGRGSASFIECVLVAELAVRLIQEDMDVTTEEARAIMEESKALGEMIHEDV
ncbi:RTC4-like domain-containing protein [Dactylonectria macrodidyma]|uniref:Restriction of telomere capping protein 4 n=1 Tax=Dactylonectria macrodidyma TaxID=307937 RepID=A0A9P9E805_9HYPO|nr:RTC4-like domain-containing protein [Dactylonectria macrodidyma]